MSYPLRIRFWYTVHNYAERFWHWVWFAKLQPWHQSQEIQLPPTYRLIEDHGDRKIYASVGGYGSRPPVKYKGDGSYTYKVTFAEQPKAE